MTNEVCKGDVLSFMLGGNAEFTIFQEPNIAIKYKLVANENGSVFFVYTEGTDSVKISYQGYIIPTQNVFLAKAGKCKNQRNERALKGLEWVLKHHNNLGSKVHILHHGKCSVCGRKLKDFESLQCGIGPTCYKKISGGT